MFKSYSVTSDFMEDAIDFVQLSESGFFPTTDSVKFAIKHSLQELIGYAEKLKM